MTEYGKNIEGLNNQITTLTNENKSSQEALKKFEGIDVEKLKEKYENIENSEIKELNSEKYDRFYIDLQRFAKGKLLNKLSLKEFSKEEFKHDIYIGKINFLGELKDKSFTDELIVTRERVNHILEEHSDIKNINFSAIKKIITNPDGIIKDKDYPKIYSSW